MRPSSSASCDGRIVKTLPRRHTGDIVRPGADKKHASRRAADMRRRAGVAGEEAY
jgi:hypothetical protein